MFRVFLIGSPASSRRGGAPWWAILAMGVAGAALLSLMLLVGAFVILAAAPLVLAVFLIGRWRLRRVLREVAERSGRDSRIIDADYRVIDESGDQ